MHDVCFWMNGEAMCENSQVHDYTTRNSQRISNKKPYKASLSLQSCEISGFYNQIRAGCNATLELEKCYLQDSMSSSIMIVNPSYFKMLHCNLIRTQINSGLNIRWLSDSIDKHISRIIDIQQNDFGINHICGVEI